MKTNDNKKWIERIEEAVRTYPGHEDFVFGSDDYRFKLPNGLRVELCGVTLWSARITHLKVEIPGCHFDQQAKNHGLGQPWRVVKASDGHRVAVPSAEKLVAAFDKLTKLKAEWDAYHAECNRRYREAKDAGEANEAALREAGILRETIYGGTEWSREFKTEHGLKVTVRRDGSTCRVVADKLNAAEVAHVLARLGITVEEEGARS